LTIYRIEGPIDDKTCDKCKSLIGSEYPTMMFAKSMLSGLLMEHSDIMNDPEISPCRCYIKEINWYFISYQFWVHDLSKIPVPTIAETYTNKHPIEWLIEIRKKIPKNDYYIQFWSEIPKEIGMKYTEETE